MAPRQQSPIRRRAFKKATLGRHRCASSCKIRNSARENGVSGLRDGSPRAGRKEVLWGPAWKRNSQLWVWLTELVSLWTYRRISWPGGRKKLGPFTAPYLCYETRGRQGSIPSLPATCMTGRAEKAKGDELS